MRKLVLALLLALVPMPAFAQGRTTIAGGTSLPANCNPRDLFFKTAATVGVYECGATDTWRLVGTAVTVNLATNVTGRLPFANLTQGSALSVLGVTGNATADVASIAAGSDKQVLRRSGTAVSFGAVDLTSSAAVTGILPIANIATGTPDGTKFVRDDGTLAVPAGTGTGTVSSIATTSPITGGTITTTGTIACATCATTSATLTANRLLKGNGGVDLTVGDLTGDVTTSGTMATTLANSGVTAGDYGSAIVTFDAKGRATAAVQNYLQYRDEKTQNTAGGGFSSGAWRTRTLNTEVSDVGGFGSLSSNQITLTAGTYYIRVQAPAFSVRQNQIRLQNVTDTATILVGGSIFSGDTSGVQGFTTYATLEGVFTIAASKALEIQHQCALTRNTDGFGVQANFTTEVYTVVELWKIG